MKDFWQNLKIPFFILAPMEDVTDTVFRRIVMQCGKPDVFFTEFTSVEGMFSKGDKVVNQRLLFTNSERPIVAQIWGLKPENYFKAGKLLSDMGFDGIDINMGCPEKGIVRKGACSGLINNPSLAKEIIHATKEGAPDLPVSVKTRIGFKKIQTEEWIGFLLDQNLSALTIHGRTTAEMSAVPAHWDEIGKVVEMRDSKQPKKNPLVIPSDQSKPRRTSKFMGGNPNPENINSEKTFEFSSDDKASGVRSLRFGRDDNTFQTLIIGNGDIQSLEEANEKVDKYHVDGVMIGRGIFHNIWLFDQTTNPKIHTLEERLQILWNHVELYDTQWGKNKPFQILKKFFKIYISGFDGAQELRMRFMETKNKEDVEKLLESLKIFDTEKS